MQHPNKKQHEIQMKFLAKLTKERVEEQARLFRFINAGYIYHKQANSLNPTKADFQEWLTGLPENTRINMEIIGFAWCKKAISFKRYILEKNDVGMDHWMQQNLTEDDYMEYRELIEQEEKS